MIRKIPTDPEKQAFLEFDIFTQDSYNRDYFAANALKVESK